MKLVFIFTLTLSFLACEISVQKLPCIFGGWKVSKITGPDGSLLPEIKLSANFPSLTDSTLVEFLKSDQLVIGQSPDTITFKFNETGMSFKGLPEDLLATNVRVEGDSMVLNFQQNTITFKRPEN